MLPAVNDVFCLPSRIILVLWGGVGLGCARVNSFNRIVCVCVCVCPPPDCSSRGRRYGYESRPTRPLPSFLSGLGCLVRAVVQFLRGWCREEECLPGLVCLTHTVDLVRCGFRMLVVLDQLLVNMTGRVPPI